MIISGTSFLLDFGGPHEVIVHSMNTFIRLIYFLYDFFTFNPDVRNLRLDFALHLLVSLVAIFLKGEMKIAEEKKS